jgi:FkbM family methyltransferase
LRFNRRIFGDLIQRIFGKADLVILRKNRFNELYEKIDQYSSYIKWSEGLEDSAFREFMKKHILGNTSSAQLQQDLVALYVAKIHGAPSNFFVEFGATDGKTYSNTFLLEKEFSWDGILAEPAKTWEGKLKENRHCNIDLRCVWSKSGESLEFFEVDDASYSTLSGYSTSDQHHKLRENKKSYTVSTVTLGDLLSFHGAPRTISYLSLDTEGSEFEILRNFDFNSYEFNFISVEHNFSKNRESIHDLLTKHGYIRILVNFSEWDDWYIRVCQETENFLGVILEKN